MVAKAREMIASTICDEIERTIMAQINARLRQMSRAISMAQLLRALASNKENPSENGMRPVTDLNVRKIEI